MTDYRDRCDCCDSATDVSLRHLDHGRAVFACRGCWSRCRYLRNEARTRRGSRRPLRWRSAWNQTLREASWEPPMRAATEPPF